MCFVVEIVGGWCLCLSLVICYWWLQKSKNTYLAITFFIEEQTFIKSKFDSQFQQHQLIQM